MITKTFAFLERSGPKWLKNLIPEKWRIWVGYQVKVRMGRDPEGFDLRRPLPLPAGQTRQQIFDYLATLRGKDTADQAEIFEYLNEACDRYLYTLDLVPAVSKGSSGRLLDIGASPYHLTMLIKRFHSYELSLINYFGDTVPSEHHEVIYDNQGEKIKLDYHNINVEVDGIPYPDNSFDVVMMCEVLEHFTNDPVKVIGEIKRVLTDNGTCILSTPNVARLENISRLIAGQNMYDPYSGYGPYGRHNREYTQEELKKLFEAVGFMVDSIFTSDVHKNRADFFYDTNDLQSLLANRNGDLGHYIFVKATNRPGNANVQKPNWLYRSYSGLGDDC